MDEVLLKIENLSVAYGAIKALNGVSISVKKGSITAILGANGAGKTTLLSAASGLVTPQSGRIIFEGVDYQGTAVKGQNSGKAKVVSWLKNFLNGKVSPSEIARKGIIQSPEGRKILVGLTVEENLKIGAYSVKGKGAKQKTEKTLSWVYELFPRLKERSKQQANTLSGGEQQMLAIGRALMASPKLLILDEPSLGLAPMIVKDIFRIILQIKEQGTTILIVEQNALQTLKIADYAYVLELGKVGTEGPASELINDKRLIEAYLGG